MLVPMVAGHEETQAACRKSGGVEILVKAMSQHTQENSMKESGLRVLSLISDEDSLKPFHSQVLKTACAVMAERQSSDVQRSGCDLIRKLAGDPKNAKATMEAALETLLCAMEEYESDNEVQAQGCAALGRLAESSPEVASKMAPDAAPVIVKCMEDHPAAATVTLSACKALSMMLMDKNNVMTVHQAGGIQAVVKAMRSTPDDLGVQEYGAQSWRLYRSETTSLTFEAHRVVSTRS